MEKMRLDKYLTQTAGLSRSEAKQYLKKGRVCVDGQIIKKPETKIDAGQAAVTVDGRLCHYEKYTYLMLHKPQGVVSATEDDRERTVLDLIGEPVRGLFPVVGWIKIQKDCSSSPTMERWPTTCSPPKNMWINAILPFWTARWARRNRRPLLAGWISEMRSGHCRRSLCPCHRGPQSPDSRRRPNP